jgi:alanine dehydrogenase
MYKIGLPKEIKEYESRVSLVPNDVHRLLDSNDNILIYVQTNAGIEAGYSDNDYIAMGAIIVDTIEDIYSKANIIVKVKEPQEKEYELINNCQENININVCLINTINYNSFIFTSLDKARRYFL